MTDQAARLPLAGDIDLALMLDEQERRKARRRLDEFFPDTGPLRRDLYARHMEFFRLGARFPFRCFMAGNRTGKTEGGGGYELTLHLTGRYPPWWQGRRFGRPVDAWVAGDTKETVRDIIQAKLVGKEGAYGTGLIPGDAIVDVTRRPNGNGALDIVRVRHVSGGTSVLGFKSYDQKREAFQGTEKDIVLLDEESPEGVREECVLRLMTTGGMLMETYTPLRGLTTTVQKYLPHGYRGMRTVIEGDRALVMAGWDDVPHLGDEEKRRMLAESSPHTRDARSRGIPSLGSGAIYPIPESEFVVPDQAIPGYWKKVYGLDVGWNRTAAVWGALDDNTDTLYLYSEHYRGEAEPSVHAAAIRARGRWIPGVVDPASRGRTQNDGAQLLRLYKQQGLELYPADNSVETGILDVWQRLSTGRLKVFASLQNWLMEYRVYQRDEKGRIKDGPDHLMDATRYLCRSGVARARVAAPAQPTIAAFSPLDPEMGY